MMSAPWPESMPVAAVPDAPFAEIDDAAWHALLADARPVHYPAGTVIVHKGSPCRNFLFITEGTIRVQQVSDSGRKVLLYRMGPGDISVMAISSLVKTGTCPAEAVADTDVSALSVPLGRCEEAVARSPVLRRILFEAMATRVHQLMTLIDELAFQTLDVRLAATLKRLFDGAGCDLIRITHEELAMELGTTRVVVSRLLKDIERNKGCVRLLRGRIKLLSAKCLSQCARKGFYSNEATESGEYSVSPCGK